MDLGLKDKVAFIAGSSRGIGKAIACEFASEGSCVVITGRNGLVVEQTVKGMRDTYGADQVLGCPGDLSSWETIREIVSAVCGTWGGIDCLIANIGSGTAKPGWELNEADWSEVLELNFSASRRMAEAVIPGMIGRRGGSIVFIGSIAGLETIGAPLTYSAAKAALVSYSKNLSRSLGVHGIRVNCVLPGNILFPGGSWEKKLAAEPERFGKYIEAEVPLARFGRPEEIASLVVFLCSKKASFITGASIVADGGQTRSV